MDQPHMVDPDTIGGERKQITAVFIDVVDSSRVAATLDPEDLQDWLDAFYARTRDIVEALDGEVTEYLGDGIIAIFGLRRSDELTASKAVNAALKVLSRIDDRSIRGLKVRLRIGVATGEAAVRAQTDGKQPRATGLVTTLAQRIQDRANPGHVLIAETTFQLLRDTIAVEPVPGMALKGMPKTQTLYRPLRNQPLYGDAKQPFFVGRGDALATIAASSRPTLIIGQAGIGKSALVRRIAQDAPSEMTVAGDGVFIRATYRPFNRWAIQQMGQPIPNLADLQATFPDLNDPLSAALSLALGIPEGQSLLAQTSGPAIKTLTQTAFWKAIQSAQTDGLLIFEDLHWYDNASLDVLAHIVNSPEAARYRIVMTSRADPRIAEQLGMSEIETLKLGPLNPDQSRDMLRALAPDGADPKATSDLLERAAGIPLFLQHLSNWQTGGDKTATSVPQTLTDLLAAKIDATDAAKPTLQCAAVIGQTFDMATLCAVAPDPALVEGHIRLAAAQSIIQQTSPTEWSFQHALLRQVAYQGLLRKKRVAYHSAIAAYLQTHQSDIVRRTPSLLTNHLYLAEQYIPAIQNYYEVSQWALFQGAFKDATLHITQAIALCGKVPDAVDARPLEVSCQALHGAILMQTQGFRTQPVREVFDRIATLATQQNIFAAENGPAFYGSFTYALSTSNKDKARWFADRLTETTANLTKDPAYHDLRQAKHNVDVGLQFYKGDYKQAFESFAEMRRHYDPDKRHSMIANYGIDGFASAQMFEAVGRAFCGDAQLVRGLNTETHMHQDLLNIPNMRPYALIWGGVALYYAGAQALARDHIAQGMALAQETDSAFWQLTGAAWQFVFNPTLSVSVAGCAAWGQNLQTHEMIGATLALPFYRANYALALLRNGQTDAALAAATHAAAEVQQSGMFCWLPEVTRCQAAVHLKLGHTEKAQQLLEDAAKTARNQGAKLWLLRAQIDQLAAGFIDTDTLQSTIDTFSSCAQLPELMQARDAVGHE